MTSRNVDRAIEQDARLVILQELHRQRQGTLNDMVLSVALEASGHDRSREWMRTQLHKMAELGAIELTEAGTALIARITTAGVGHVLRRDRIEGIKQPELGV